MSSGQAVSRKQLWRQARPVCCLLYVSFFFVFGSVAKPRFSFVVVIFSFFFLLFPGVPVVRDVGGVKGASGCSKGLGVAALP